MLAQMVVRSLLPPLPPCDRMWAEKGGERVEKYEALALIYVQAQDLTGKQPEDLAVLYDDALSRINAKSKELSYCKKNPNPIPPSALSI